MANNQDAGVDWNNEDNVATLKRLWALGESFTKIAAVIPGGTRNSIAGKVYRLQLPSRKRPTRPGTRRAA